MKHFLCIVWQNPDYSAMMAAGAFLQHTARFERGFFDASGVL